MDSVQIFFRLECTSVGIYVESVRICTECSKKVAGTPVGRYQPHSEKAVTRNRVKGRSSAPKST